VRCRERERERERESRVEVENLRGVRACENGTHNLQKKKKKKINILLGSKRQRLMISLNDVLFLLFLSGPRNDRPLGCRRPARIQWQRTTNS
jgi:hypothetical protein